LPRQPGAKESRYAHLLSGPVESAIAAEAAFIRRDDAQDVGHEDRIAQLEASVAALKQEVSALRLKIEDLFGD
jgi:uncharacterized protein YceH (UPF0502 family)